MPKYENARELGPSKSKMKKSAAVKAHQQFLKMRRRGSTGKHTRSTKEILSGQLYTGGRTTSGMKNVQKQLLQTDI